MKKFNLDDALAGKPVVTRNGLPVSSIQCFPILDLGGMSIAAVVDGRLLTFRHTGEFGYLADSENDLFMAGEKKEGWINIYRTDRGTKPYLAGFTAHEGLAPTHVFHTMRDAERHAEKYPAISTAIRIEWEE